MADYVKLAWSSKYKTFQLFDLSKRLYRYLVDDLKILEEFESTFGERADFQHDFMNSLNVLQNFHTLGKIVAAYMTQSYPTALCGVVFMEGCCLLVVALARENILRPTVLFSPGSQTSVALGACEHYLHIVMSFTFSLPALDLQCAQAPLLPASESGASGSVLEIQVPEFTAQRSLGKEVDRIRTEIGGAPFMTKIFKEKSKKAQTEDEAVVSLADLLHPKKKARTVPKRKAAAKSVAGSSQGIRENVDDVQADIVDHTYGSSRRRWWLDDLLACLLHAAGASGGGLVGVFSV